jgi:hypothetical protein
MDREELILARLDTVDAFIWESRCRGWRNHETCGVAVYNVYMYVAGNVRITVDQLEDYINQLPPMFLKPERGTEEIAPQLQDRTDWSIVEIPPKLAALLEFENTVLPEDVVSDDAFFDTLLLKIMDAMKEFKIKQMEKFRKDIKDLS